MRKEMNSIFGYKDSLDEVYDNTMSRDHQSSVSGSNMMQQSFINMIYPSMNKKLIVNNEATDRSYINSNHSQYV